MNSDIIGNKYIIELVENPEIYWYKTNWVNATDPTEAKFLELFCFGTIKDWQSRWPQLQLTERMIIKLQKLTLITLCLQNRTLTYSLLLEETKISNYQTLEEYLMSLREFFQTQINSVKGLVTVRKLLDSRDVYGYERPLLLLDNPHFDKARIIKDLLCWKNKLINELSE